MISDKKILPDLLQTQKRGRPIEQPLRSFVTAGHSLLKLKYTCENSLP